jgi:signal transduction histidine kinase
MRVKLATKISTTIAGVVALAVASSAIAIVAARHVGAVLEETVAENVRSIQYAEQLGGVLLSQKGLVSRYFLTTDDSGKAKWRKILEERESRFLGIIADVRNTTHVSEKEADVLSRLERTYSELVANRTTAIRTGPRATAQQVAAAEASDTRYETAYGLCEEFVAASNEDVRDTTARAMARVRQVTWLVGLSVVVTIGLGGALLWLFFYRVLFPLRGMVADARLFRGDAPARSPQAVDDELRAVGDSLRSLMSDVADTRSRLERSRNRLLSTEKLASVGKLAAGVAHEIRNPLTAMKMWLFSIREAVEGNPDLERKVRVVSEEVVRLESIVRSFLEFSRPPAMKPRPMDISDILGHTLELLGPRFREGKIRVVRKTASGLPPALADPEQLKQVFINLLANSAEVLGAAGEIRVATTAERDAAGRLMVVVRIQDTGPGMPEEVQSRIFEPFFSTKDDGTGLGLCIAAQIMARHEGLLVLESSTSQGTTFAVWTPAAPDPSGGQETGYASA